MKMSVNDYPEKMRVSDYLVNASHPWNLSKRCPNGSIPIREVQGYGHFRDGSSVSARWRTNARYSLRQDQPEDHEHSCIEVRRGKYYGAKTSINVWNPKVGGKDEFSLSQIWVISGDRATSLEAGWVVNPAQYGDYRTRFFIYWTTDDYKTGCANLQCPGFVQTNSHTILDSLLQPVSVYGGEQYSIEVEISKDKTTGNWWLLLQAVQMGYWPKELVPSLVDGAHFLQFGGEILNFKLGGEHTTTQMGSGHFSYEGFRKSSFFKNIQVLDPSYTYSNPDPSRTRVAVESPKCYDLHVSGNRDGPWGYFFFYGGPGRFQQCT